MACEVLQDFLGKNLLARISKGTLPNEDILAPLVEIQGH